jgi:hypothetical protein
MVVRRILLGWMFLAACGPGDLQPDADGEDGDVPMGNLAVEWTAPALGEPIGDAVIDEVRLHLRDIRAVGDAAGDVTYVAMREIQLDGDDEPRIEFGGAPPGRYSGLEFRLAGELGEDEAWEMQGEADVDGGPLELEIEDDVMSPVNLPLEDFDLAPGENRVIVVELDLVAVLEPVDFSTVEVEDDRIIIDDESPLLPGIRSRLVAAFSIASID